MGSGREWGVKKDNQCRSRRILNAVISVVCDIEKNSLRVSRVCNLAQWAQADWLGWEKTRSFLRHCGREAACLVLWEAEHFVLLNQFGAGDGTFCAVTRHMKTLAAARIDNSKKMIFRKNISH